LDESAIRSATVQFAPEFRLCLIKEFQRLKETEYQQPGWDILKVDPLIAFGTPVEIVRLFGGKEPLSHRYPAARKPSFIPQPPETGRARVFPGSGLFKVHIIANLK